MFCDSFSVIGKQSLLGVRECLAAPSFFKGDIVVGKVWVAGKTQGTCLLRHSCGYSTKT